MISDLNKNLKVLYKEYDRIDAMDDDDPEYDDTFYLEDEINKIEEVISILKELL